MKKNKTLLLFITVLILLSVSIPTFATTWETVHQLSNYTLWFYVYEEGYLLPRAVPVAGCWDECWDGTQGGWATLNRLYHSAIIVNYNPTTMYFIDDFYPQAHYNDGSTNSYWGIVYPYSWTLHSSNNLYNEGYNNPGTYYNYPSVTGFSYVYAPDTVQILMSGNVSWFQ